jgi:transposase
MYYTGIDLHRKTSFITTINENGHIVKKRNLQNQATLITDYFSELEADTQVVIESTASWHWLHDLLTDHGISVILSNPSKTKAIASAKIKNDRIDSHMLAQLLRAKLIAPVHVSNQASRQLKELLRHRNKLVRDKTRLKNRIHNILAKNNHQVTVSDLFGKKGLRFLSEVELPPCHRSQIETYLYLYDILKEQIQPLTETICQLSGNNDIAKLLMTVPGIGPITAMTIVAEIDDISRFASYRKLASYAGLVPSLDSSAGRNRTGRITKQGSAFLRTAMIEAAQAAVRKRNSKINVYFRRLIVRSGYPKAITATAHKLLQYVFYIWKNQTPYHEQLQAAV